MANVEVEQNLPVALEVIRHAGAWMRDTGKRNYSAWWDPDRVSEEMLAPYAKPDEFYVFSIDGRAAGAAIIQREQSMQDWTAIDGTGPAPEAIYIHYVAVKREFAKMGLVGEVIAEAERVAREQGIALLRLDTNANESKLCQLYESYGFRQVGTETEGDHTTAFYEKQLA